MSSIIPDLELPILVVDDAHWQKVNSTNTEALEYSITSRDGFQISTQDFDFIIPEGVDYKEPNIIQIVVGKEQLYATAFEYGCSLYTIDKTNMVALYGSHPFGGFQKGMKLIVAIGHLAPPKTDLPRPKFTVLWAGVVNIL
jgi:hypothetical protein